jgi:hypothetical protein
LIAFLLQAVVPPWYRLEVICLQLRDAFETQLASASKRMTDALRRNDDIQADFDLLQAKCKELEAHLQTAKQTSENAEKNAAARELLIRRQAEAEASQMYRQLNIEHENSISVLRQQMKDESSLFAADRAANASALHELEASRAALSAEIEKKDGVIAAKEKEVSKASAAIQNLKQSAEYEKAAAAASHTLAMSTQEAAHTASVEALQATFEMQLRQFRLTSQGAIDSVGKSQDALTMVPFYFWSFDHQVIECAGVRQQTG